ncbi:MAG TPA: CDP-diacylglycerol--glycerol-3-phosphate 3-phosphatidyltransferase [Gemmataceae bacterium]|nr:CDP-diacylglycerol--glycerol-3-phosphate 3-phosphatidyltransferase [Gemmataceae bacterium]
MATVTPGRPPVFNLPNQLTATRLILALVLFVLIALEAWLWCLAIFAVAAATDWLDGYLARRQGLTSTLGRNLDPLVDKVLMCGAYIFLLPLGASEKWLLPWMVTVVVARELVITGLRSFMENQGASFGADWLGKVKMVLQCAALIAVFVELHLRTTGASAAMMWFAGTSRDSLIYAMLAATALSGLQYLWKAALLLKIDE